MASIDIGIGRTERVSADWAALYSEHAPAIAAFLTKLTGDRDTALELVQETFVRAIRSRQDPDALGSARGWLFRVAGNLARDHARRRALLRFVPFTGREPDPRRLGDPEIELVHRALRLLPASQAETLLLHYDAGFTRKEIAAMHGVGEEAVKSRLARGRDAFARAYERAGGEL